MKKTILILILILPVVVVSLVYMIAGFVVREAAVLPITGVRMYAPIMNSYNIFRTGDYRAMVDNDGWSVGKTIDLRTFVFAQPEPSARFNNLYIRMHFTHADDKEYECTTDPRVAAIIIDDYGRVVVNRATVGLATVLIDDFFLIEIDPNAIQGGA